MGDPRHSAREHHSFRRERLNDRRDRPASSGTARTGGASHTDSGRRLNARAATARSQVRIVVPASHAMVNLVGSRDELLRVIEDAFSCDIHVRGNEITITGDTSEIGLAAKLFDELISLLDRGDVLTAATVQRSMSMLRADPAVRPAEVFSLNVLSARGRNIRPKTVNQRAYVEAIDRHTIIFAIGPAGTGKTYLAMAKAVQALQSKQVNRIILTRPAVEAGERLGFLPGTLTEKIDPYLRPLYDALHDMIDPESIPRLMAAGTIEVAPLAYMRGRAQPVDTPVLTPTGFVPIGALRVGDLVVGSNGLPTPVLGVYPQGRKNVFRVATQDGASTVACGEHLWFVRTPGDRRSGTAGRVVQTADMVGKLRTVHHRTFELPLVGAVEFEPSPVPLDPYAMGLLLGDRCRTPSTTPAFATLDREPASALDVGGRRGGAITADPLTQILRDLDLAGTCSTPTFVPAVYLHNSPSVRLAVLQGLLDTDGGPVRQRGGTCRVQYMTCSDHLRDDVIHLVRSLGGVASSPTRLAADAHVVDIRLPNGVAPFRLARKSALYDEHRASRPIRFIDSIEPAGEAECVCISVGAADSLYVTSDFLVTHNTLNDAFIILDEAQNTTPEQMKMFLTRLGFGAKMVVTGDITQVDLPGNSTSGLRVVRDILDDVDDVHFATLDSADVVRHKLVGDIVDAYEKYDAERGEDDANNHDDPLGPRRRSRG